MRADDPAIHWVPEPQLNIDGKDVPPLVRPGTPDDLPTFEELLVGKNGHGKLSGRGTRDRQSADLPGCPSAQPGSEGRVKCVACFLCATACPAHCIDIIAAESPWEDREKYPESFVIDELRCIYCGMCEEACPVDAIELTSLYNLTGRSREEMVFDKEKLLSVYDQTKDKEPMKSEELGGTL
jgi:NADH-quinone oxidoreductase subunit I